MHNANRLSAQSGELLMHVFLCTQLIIVVFFLFSCGFSPCLLCGPALGIAVHSCNADGLVASQQQQQQQLHRRNTFPHNENAFRLACIQHNFGLFTHPGPYEEQEHVLPQDAQNQPPYLENSPEFYAGMVDHKYNQHYPKNTYNNIRGECRSSRENVREGQFLCAVFACLLFGGFA